MIHTEEELAEKRQVILKASAVQAGAFENRVTQDPDDARIVRALLREGLLERRFADTGAKSLGFLLFITEKGREELIPDEEDAIVVQDPNDWWHRVFERYDQQ